MPSIKFSVDIPDKTKQPKKSVEWLLLQSRLLSVVEDKRYQDTKILIERED